MDNRRRGCVFGCDIRGIPLHGFPHPVKKPDLFIEWCTITGIQQTNPMHTYVNRRVCSCHFLPEHITSGHRLIQSVLPTLHLQGVHRSLETIIREEHNYCCLRGTKSSDRVSAPLEHAVLAALLNDGENYSATSAPPTHGTTSSTDHIPGPLKHALPAALLNDGETYPLTSAHSASPTHVSLPSSIIQQKLTVMEEVIDVKKMCRACLVDTGPFTSLFSPSRESLLYSELFKYCTSVEVSESDQLPKQMCETCADLLKTLYSFKKMSLKSNAILKQHLNSRAVKIEFQPTDNYSVDEASADSNDICGQSSSSDEDSEPQTELPVLVRRRRKGEPMLLKKRTKMQCPKCDRSFQKYENFEAHLRSHFGKKPDIRCVLCDKTFRTLRNLQSHSRTHTGVRKYQCRTCGKSFAYLNVLKTHELIHSGVKEHACHLCDAKFVQRYNLKSHLQTHTKEKNYNCAQCGKKFAQAGNLKTHLIRHTGIKSHACTLCDMRFYIKSDLFKHMRSHSNDKPFACDFCDKSFKNKSFKIVHLRSHTGERPYACDICPKRFMAHKDMRNHRMIHTGEKPHKCVLCSQAFIQKCALNRHMKSHKNDEPPVMQQPITAMGVTYTDWNT